MRPFKTGDDTSQHAPQTCAPARFRGAREDARGIAAGLLPAYLSLFVMLLFAFRAEATQFWLRSDAGSVAGYKFADILRGTGVTTSVTDTVAGPTAGVQCTATSGGAALAWITEPLSS